MGKVIGQVTLSKAVPQLKGARYLLVVPESVDALRGRSPARGAPLVAYDETGAGQGSRVALSEGREASMPFYPNSVPIDAYCAAIVDEVNLKI